MPSGKPPACATGCTRCCCRSTWATPSGCPPACARVGGAAALEAYQPPAPHPLAQARAAVVRTLAAQLRALLDQERALAAQIRQLARPYAALAALPGLGMLGAGMLAAQLGPGQRFRTDAQLAAHAGVAPLEASSGHLRRHRLNREGNRVLNLIFYRIAMTQARDDPRAKAYLARKQAEGHSWREAIRALKRFIARAVFRIWRTCSTPAAGLAT